MGEVQVFLVRVWQHLGQFRASVRLVGQDEVWLFVEPQQLTEHLRAASTAGPAASFGQPSSEPSERDTAAGKDQEDRP